ncbi:type IV pilin [Methanoregula sp.]|uniref:type IV pilin n=1 Tax=Methanoregula sp. TaxID=2052170 RepID=UPI0023758310|nr:type IV pilin [Methanoregula sp.]MDD1686446.1 type IV pilin [Methanoregula sp.]
MKIFNEHAVSPVVGVMLMLVVVVIIAAIVSGVAGGMAKGQTKSPQATIQGEFSVTSGLQIIHAGGDVLPTNGLVITVANGPAFGSNLESYTLNTVDMANVTNAAGTPVAFRNPTSGQIDGYNITAFSPGDTYFVNITNCEPTFFQKTVYSSKGTYTYDGTHWTFSKSGDSFWALNFVNPANIGKTFYLDVSDKASGALISRSVVKITG